MSGKGDTPRPKSVSEEVFGSEWDRIFSQGKKPEPNKEDSDGE